MFAQFHYTHISNSMRVCRYLILPVSGLSCLSDGLSFRRPSCAPFFAAPTSPFGFSLRSSSITAMNELVHSFPYYVAPSNCTISLVCFSFNSSFYTYSQICLTSVSHCPTLLVSRLAPLSLHTKWTFSAATCTTPSLNNSQINNWCHKAWLSSPTPTMCNQ